MYFQLQHVKGKSGIQPEQNGINNEIANLTLIEI